MRQIRGIAAEQNPNIQTMLPPADVIGVLRGEQGICRAIWIQPAGLSATRSWQREGRDVSQGTDGSPLPTLLSSGETEEFAIENVVFGLKRGDWRKNARNVADAGEKGRGHGCQQNGLFELGQKRIDSPHWTHSGNRTLQALPRRDTCRQCAFYRRVDCLRVLRHSGPMRFQSSKVGPTVARCSLSRSRMAERPAVQRNNLDHP